MRDTTNKNSAGCLSLQYLKGEVTIKKRKSTPNKKGRGRASHIENLIRGL